MSQANSERPQLGNFSRSWDEASRKFRAAALAAGARLEQIALPHLKEAGVSSDADGRLLCIDVAVFSADDNGDDVSKNQKILLYTAGQHGVEGYAGSAILIDLCEQIQAAGGVAAAVPEGGKIIFVHVMNPHGMREWRRWNESNVDLNRNNGITQLEFLERAENPDPIYVKYDKFLNPTKKLSFCDCFTPRLLCLIAKEGFNNGKQALAGGQRHKPTGLFFGGTQWEAGPKAVFAFLNKEGVSETNCNLQAFFHVDLHTGVGPYKHDSLLAEDCFLSQLAEIFGGKGDLKSDWHLDGIGTWVQRAAAPLHDTAGESKQVVVEITSDREAKDGVAYSPKGHIGGGLFFETSPPHMHKIQNGKKHQLLSADWVSVTQEFGTRKGTKMFELLRAENAMTGEIVLQDPDFILKKSIRNRPERVALFDAFCPADPAWRTFVLERGRVVFQQARAHVFR